jgi:SSS family solute:Na+ symporter
VIPAIVVFCYLAIVVYIGIFAFRRGKNTGEDFFLASRSLGPYVFIFSLFGTNMTAFAILGSSGLAYQRGIGVYGLMASASGFVIPLTIFFIGTRLWALGKKYGHMTQVQYFRDRWECSKTGTVIFLVTAVMLVPYLVIGTMGGGSTLESLTTITGDDHKPKQFQVYENGQPKMKPVLVQQLSVDGKPLHRYKLDAAGQPVLNPKGKPVLELVKAPKLDAAGKVVTEPVTEHKHWVPYEVGAAIVALVVMSYVFFGGMRGTAWVNTFQVILFLCFGAIAFYLISRKLGGFAQIMQDMAAHPRTLALLQRDRIPMAEFFSYTFIPLSAIMFPHIAIMCLTAEKITHFKKTVIFYPICIAAIWLPSVYLGVIAAQKMPGLMGGDTNDVIPRMLLEMTGPMMAGVLGAGIMACVMASDSQILALCTMFTEDIFAYYGGKQRFGEKAQIWTGRAFIVLVTIAAYVIGIKLKDAEGIFELAIRFNFSGFAALAPIMLAALFWKRSTKYGALAAVLWVAFAMTAMAWLYFRTEGIAPAPGQPAVPIYPALGNLLLRTPGNVTVFGYLPVMPMTIISGILVVVVSLITPGPSQTTLNKYFPKKP